MNTYFTQVTTLEELRKQYKELLKKYHPDNVNSSTQATQEINAEYDNLFKQLKDKHEENRTDKDSDYTHMKYDFTKDETLRKVLQSIIGYVGIDIKIIGCWIWQ